VQNFWVLLVFFMGSKVKLTSYFFIVAENQMVYSFS
jgi:hypothetical protein